VIGATATSTLTTTIILTGIPTGTLTAARVDRATGGSTTRSTGEMHRTAIAGLTNDLGKTTAAREIVARAIVGLGLATDRVVVQVPATVLVVAPELEIVLGVVPERVIVPAVVRGLEIVRVEEALVRDHPHDHPAGAKLAITQLHRDRPRLAVAGLAAVAETTRDRAAPGAAVAWVEAVTAVGAVVADDRRNSRRGTIL